MPRSWCWPRPASASGWPPERLECGSPLITTTTTVQTVSTGTITQTVSSIGTIEPPTQANLNFAVSGRVTAVDVSAGQTVAVGQAWPPSTDTLNAASLAQAQAKLANDQAQLATDQADGASSTQIALDKANIASAQNQVTTAQTALSEATLTRRSPARWRRWTSPWASR